MCVCVRACACARARVCVRVCVCARVCVCVRETDRQRKREIREEFSCLFNYLFSLYWPFLTSCRFETVITNSALLLVSLRMGRKNYRTLIIYYSLYVFNPNVSLFAG